MKKILDYQLFLESLSSGKSLLYFSTRFRNLIESISSKKDVVAIFIKESENWKNFQDDITFIDSGDTEDTVSFIQVNRLDRFRQNDTLFNKKVVVDVEDGEVVKKVTPIEDLSKYIEKVWRVTGSSLNHEAWEKQRTQISIGRFANRVASLQDITIKPDQLEKFVNNYKSAFKGLQNIEEKFEIVEGEDIRRYYLSTNYQENKGQLFSSCMKYSSCQPYFDIYVLNPEVCKMLVLKGKEEGKISGRSLLWTTTSGETYMDRQYTNQDADIQLFKDFAKKKGWRYYGETTKKDFEVKVKDIDYKYFPYMDSLKFYNPEEDILSTNTDYSDNKNWWRLEKTDGGYIHLTVYSEYYDTYLDDEDAVWAVDLESYIPRDYAVYVDSEDAFYHYENNYDIVYSEWEEVYILMEDAVYSERVESYLTIDYSVEVWINSKKQDWLPKSLARSESQKVTIDGKEKLCLINSITKDKEGNWYFKD